MKTLILLLILISPKLQANAVTKTDIIAFIDRACGQIENNNPLEDDLCVEHFQNCVANSSFEAKEALNLCEKQTASAFHGGK